MRARLPRPLVVGFAALGYRVMEARHLRGIQPTRNSPRFFSASSRANHLFRDSARTLERIAAVRLRPGSAALDTY
jgi:hypothetical protein